MLWFLKDKDDDRKKKRRRRSSRSSSSRGSDRPDPGDRSSRSKRSRRSRRSISPEDRRDTTREDTRDRDRRRKEKSRDRDVAREQEEIFGALNYDEEPARADEIDHIFGQVLNIALYAMLALLVGGVLVYAVDRGLRARRAAEVLPLNEAAMSGDLPAMRDLLGDGAPINRTGPDGWTPLQAAVRAGQLDAVRLLLDHGAPPTDSAMRTAMRYERWDVLEALVEAGGDPEVRGTWSGRSPLELAVERKDIEMVRLLLANGADPDAVTNAGPRAQPALHYAAERGMREYVELLLEHGANPHTRWMGYLPRDLAENAGHEELARLLASAESRA
jgi:hypothetical protein